MEIRCPLCYALVDDRESNCRVCGTALKKSKPRNLKLIVVPIVIILLILSSLLIYISTIKVEEIQKPKGIEIDGIFTDWSDVTIVQDVVEAIPFNQNVDIVQYSVDGRYSELSFYIRVQGDMLAGEPQSIGGHMDIAYIFIDTDQSPQSGYLINGIGADFMIKMEGWQGEIFSQMFYSYTSKFQDWNQWEPEGSIAVAVSGSELEAQVDYGTLNLREHDNVDVLFYMQSWDRYEDFSDTVISNEVGILHLSQQGIGEDVISGNENRLLRLDLSALNTEITVSELRAIRTGIGSDNDVAVIRLEDANSNTIATGTINNGVAIFRPNFLLSEGQTRTLYIGVDVSGSAEAVNSIGFRIMNNHDVEIDRGTVSLNRMRPEDNHYDISYLLSVPVNVTIDGAFADWEGKLIRNDTSRDVLRADLDILRYGVSDSVEGPVFYLRVDGEIGWGKPVPYWNDVTEPPTPTQMPRTGEDYVYIFIDTISGTGYNNNLPIDADYMIEVRGRYNMVISQAYYEWAGISGEDWNWIEHGSVEVGLDMVEMEIGIGWEDIGVDPMNDKFNVYFLITDWEGISSDYSDGEGAIEGPTR